MIVVCTLGAEKNITYIYAKPQDPLMEQKANRMFREN